MLGAVALGAVLSTVWLVATPRDYRATAQVLVGPSVASSSAASGTGGQSYVSSRLSSYASLVDSTGIATSVTQQLRLRLDPTQFADHVTSFVPSKGSLIQVRAVASDARSAAALANTTSDALARAIQELETPYAGGRPRVTVTTTRPARPGGADVSPARAPGYAAGLAGGLLVGLLCATAREQADRRRLAAGGDDPTAPAYGRDQESGRVPVPR